MTQVLKETNETEPKTMKQKSITVKIDGVDSIEKSKSNTRSSTPNKSTQHKSSTTTPITTVIDEENEEIKPTHI